ncbi:MAG: ribonuclease HI family protein [Candidatus Obscuribacterales bacterium]|jgi:ribonuclease HI|nr:ribonuclease HI family protein [Candidatus Obscuribacterales bacterium]
MFEFDRLRTVLAFADGGSRGNPGPAAWGAVLEQDGKDIATLNAYLGIATNNVAEYTGLVMVLEKAAELGIKDLEVRMDSELVVKQMLGQYRVKNAGLIPLYEKAKMLSSRFPNFRIVHVRREYNKKADQLANQAMDMAAGQAQS